MVKKSRGIGLWIVRLQRWIARLFGIRSRDQPKSSILRTFQSGQVYLLLLDTDFSDEFTERIRFWKAILRAQNVGFDLVITCDRIKRTSAEIRSGELRKLAFSHRFAVFRVAKTSIAGKIRMDCLFMSELDCIRSMVFRGLDGFAPQIVDSLAIQLTKRDQDELNMLIAIEDPSGKTSTKLRGVVRDRWRDCLMHYYGEYFPDT